MITDGAFGSVLSSLNFGVGVSIARDSSTAMGCDVRGCARVEGESSDSSSQLKSSCCDCCVADKIGQGLLLAMHCRTCEEHLALLLLCLDHVFVKKVSLPELLIGEVFRHWTCIVSQSNESPEGGLFTKCHSDSANKAFLRFSAFFA